MCENGIGIHTVTVAENEAVYSKAEANGARVARQLMRRLYYPSDATLVQMLASGRILNAPATAHDVLRATQIYGKDVPSLKGKTVNHGPVASRDVLVPKNMQKEQHAHADIFHWKGHWFLLFILKPLGLLMVDWIPSNRNSQSLLEAVNKMLGKVRARGYEVEVVSTDPEKALAKLDGLADCAWDVVGSRDHEEHAEREIRFIKERMRCAEHGVPFRVANRFARWIVYGCVAAINASRSVGGNISPRESFTGVKLDYKRDLRVAFGDYAQVSVTQPGDNGPEARTVSAIALCPTGNSKGTVVWYDIKKQTEFQSTNWTPLPMPDIVLEKLEQFADADSVAIDTIPKALKNTKRRKKKATISEKEPEPRVEEIIQLPTERISVVENDAGVFSDETDENDGGDECDVSDCQNETEVADVVDELDDRGTGVSDATDESDVPDAAEVARNFGLRRSMRGRKPNAEPDVYVYHMSVKQCVEKYGEAARDAVRNELRQMLDMEVFEFVAVDDLTPKKRKLIIRSSMFMKEKFDTDGSFIKLKARLVAGGNQQDKTLYDDISSPTVSLESIMMVIAIAAAERRKIATSDVTGAFLEARMPGHEEVYMELDAGSARIVCELFPGAEVYLTKKGTLVVKLLRALYGCVQSSKLWFNHLCAVLKSMGFTVNPYDACVFNKYVNGEQITVCFHVDDVLITCVSEELISEFEEEFKKRFANVTFNRGDEHSFLSMNIKKCQDCVTVDMRGYVDKLLDGREGIVGCNSPAGENLFKIPDDSILLTDEEKENFHTDVAKLLYLSKRDRKDILVAVSHLCSRVNEPTRDDRTKLARIFGYLSRTRDLHTTFKCGVPVELTAYIDASFGVHDDGASRTRTVLMVAGAAVGAWSSKQKLVTKSSTEAELVGLSDASSSVLWSREWLMAQGYDLPPTVIYQDNQAVISLIVKGRHGKQRTKHLNVRYFFVKDRIAVGDLKLEYLSTKDMIADILTKPVAGSLLEKLRGAMLGDDAQEVFPNNS